MEYLFTKFIATAREPSGKKEGGGKGGGSAQKEGGGKEGDLRKRRGEGADVHRCMAWKEPSLVMQHLYSSSPLVKAGLGLQPP